MEDDVSSKLHHYIPQFYLRGFTDKEDMFFVYDKTTRRIYRTSTQRSFAEKHRNTGEMVHPETGEIHRSDLAEQMLAHFDGQAASTLQTIRKSSPEDAVISDEITLYEIRMLVNSIFWRSPVNDNLRNALIENSSFKDLGFGIFDPSGKRSTETEALLKTLDLWKRLILHYSCFRPSFRSIKNKTTEIGNYITRRNPITLLPLISYTGL